MCFQQLFFNYISGLFVLNLCKTTNGYFLLLFPWNWHVYTELSSQCAYSVTKCESGLCFGCLGLKQERWPQSFWKPLTVSVKGFNRATWEMITLFFFSFFLTHTLCTKSIFYKLWYVQWRPLCVLLCRVWSNCSLLRRENWWYQLWKNHHQTKQTQR